MRSSLIHHSRIRRRQYLLILASALVAAVVLTSASFTLGFQPPPTPSSLSTTGAVYSGGGPSWTSVPLPSNFPALVSPSVTYLGYSNTPPNGPFIFFGGYDPSTHSSSNATWMVNATGAVPLCPTATCPAPSPRWGAIFFHLDSGVAILYGGCSSPPIVGSYGQLTCSSLDHDIWVFEYNFSSPTASQWVREDCNYPGVHFPSTGLAQGVGEGITVNLAMMAGGESANNSASPLTWIVTNYTLAAGYTPYHLVWKTIAPMPTPQIAGAMVGPLPAAFAVCGRVAGADYQVGGATATGVFPNDQGNALTTYFAQSPCPGPIGYNATWTPIAGAGPAPPTYSGAALTNISAHFYLFGGIDSPTPTGSMEIGTLGSSGGVATISWALYSTPSPGARADAGYATGWTSSGSAQMLLCPALPLT